MHHSSFVARVTTGHFDRESAETTGGVFMRTATRFRKSDGTIEMEPTSAGRVTKKLGRWILKFVLVLVGSTAAGIFIGVLQHYVAFGVWGTGFGWEAFELALFEGGIAGGMAGIPTGLVTYYGCLGGRVSVWQVAVIVGGSLLCGCLSGLVVGYGSALVTPIITVMIAIGLRVRMTMQKRSLQKAAATKAD